MLIQLLCFWTLFIVLFLFKTYCFGEWILSLSSVKAYSVGAISVSETLCFELQNMTEFEIKSGRLIMSRNNSCFKIYGEIKFEPHHINYHMLYAVVNGLLQYCNILIS
jgi:hypothetical protein